MPLLSTLATGSGEAIGLGTSLEIDDRFANVSFVLPNVRGTSVNTSAFIDSGTANTGGTGFPITKFGNTFMGSVTPYANRDIANNTWSYEFFGGGANGTTPPSTIGGITFPSTVLTSNIVGWTSPRTNTIECWIKPACFSYAAFGNRLSNIIGTYDVDGDGRFVWGINTTGNLVLFFGRAGGAGSSYTTSRAVDVNKWNHVAVTVDGTSNTSTMFVNGIGETFSVNLTGQAAANATTYFGIGRGLVSQDVVNFIGKISNLRWSNTIVYTANFTPSTTRLTLTHPNFTHLHTLQTPHLTDGTFTPKALETGTNVIASRDSPFNQYQTARPYDPLYHGASAYFDGSTSYLTVPDDAATEIGGSNFTLECMFLPLSNTSSTLFGKRANTTTVGSMVVTYSATAVSVNIGATTAGYAIASGINAGIPKKGVWNHLAIYRIGNVWRAALNGTVVSLSSSTNAVTNVSVPWHFGGDTNGSYFNGYMTDIRLVVGSSVYSQTTVGAVPGITIPTAPLTNIANTKFLLSMNNFTYANPTMQNNIGVIGTVPLANTPSKWGYSSLVLSRTSGAINALFVPDSPSIGTNLSRVTINPSSGAGTTTVSNTNNLTIEFWFYPTSLSVANNYGVIVQKDGISTGAVMWRAALSSANTGNIVFSVGSGGAPSNSSNQYIVSNTAVSNNTWNHVACQRDNGYYNIYINGVLSANAAISAEMYPTTRPMMINWITNGLANSGVDGYLSDLRIVKGVAVYTGATAAVPTGPFGNQ